MLNKHSCAVARLLLWSTQNICLVSGKTVVVEDTQGRISTDFENCLTLQYRSTSCQVWHGQSLSRKKFTPANMSTYLRESDRYESTFPSIRNRNGLLEPTQRSRITTLDDDLLDSNLRGSRTTYTTTVHRNAPPAGGRESPVFYPRPPSPSRKTTIEVSVPVIYMFTCGLTSKELITCGLT